MRVCLVATAICFSIVGLAAADDAKAAIRKDTNVPAEGLGSALQTLAKEYDFQVLYRTEVVGSLRTEGTVGQFTPEEALKQLLKGTGLTYSYLDEKTVTIIPRAPSGAAESPSAAAGFAGSAGPSSQNEAGRISGALLAYLHGSEAAGPAEQQGGEPSANNDEGQPGSLSEVVVTAQKVKERIQDVPMAITALNGDELVHTQSYQFQDYAATVPGLTMSTFGSVGTQLIMRGITSGTVPVNPSVEVYIDETPYGVQGPFAGAYAAAPNLDTFDMQRIEVLKGPQGSLYGANALAGLVKYVTNPPDTSRFSAAIETGASSIYNGNGVGFDEHGMVNLPVSNTAALRVVGYESYSPGFIDNPSRGMQGINGSRYAGGRASFLYAPSADFSIRLNALYQETKYNDWSTEYISGATLAPVNGALTLDNVVGQPGRSTNGVYNVTVHWNTALADVVSSSSYSTYATAGIWDYSPVLGGLVTSLFGSPYGFAIANDRPATVWTQELRLSSPDSSRLGWLFGGYFTDETSHEGEVFYLTDPVAHTVLYNGPNLGASRNPTTYREFAAFANFDYHFTPTVDASVGGRYSHNDQTYHEIAPGLFGGGEDFGETSSEGVFTYSADVRWHVAPNTMTYARIATGFVPGGPNDIVPTITFLPKSYKSSTTTNYEMGIKSTLLDERLAIGADIYYIDWRDIQLEVLQSGYTSLTNGGTAASEGIEWDFKYVPVHGLTLSFNGDYDKARMTETTATTLALNAVDGDRLPYVPEWQMSAGAEYWWPLFGSYSGFVGGSWRFNSSRLVDFTTVGNRPEVPSFNFFDARAGVEKDRWTVAAYVKNIGNEIAYSGLFAWNPTSSGSGIQSAALYTPRTYGLELTMTF